ncbi:MAG TPA: hypothetical protein VGD67_13270 [Pseudonocardiaceae bacterium]
MTGAATVRLAPRNSLLLVGDPRTRNLPATLDGGLLAATENCVAVGTLAEISGPTTVTLADRDAPGPGPGPPTTVFAGRLSLPSGTLAVQTVEGESVLSRESPSGSEFVTILVNDPSEPDHIVVLVGAPPA